MPQPNYIAVLVCAVVIFALGGLWYSPVMFAKRWLALQGKTMESMQGSGGATPMMYVQVFLCGLATSAALAMILLHIPEPDAAHGAIIGAICWLGFAGATSYGSALFSLKPKGLWLIDSGYNLVSFVIAGIILGAWR